MPDAKLTIPLPHHQVEGHDWWPARVVRRRAVPREVGPPPGAPAFVRHHIPVVFFTRKGIPGEVDEGMDTANGALSACLRALKASGELQNITRICTAGRSSDLPHMRPIQQEGKDINVPACEDVVHIQGF